MLKTKIKRLLRDDRGTSATEYAFLLGFITLAIVGALQGVGNQSKINFNSILQRASDAISGVHLP